MENVSTYYDATLRIGWTWYMEQFMNLLCCYDHRLDPVFFVKLGVDACFRNTIKNSF